MCADAAEREAAWDQDESAHAALDAQQTAEEQRAEQIREELRNEDPSWIAEQNARADLFDYPGDDYDPRYDGDYYEGLGHW
jgi:hypothetical protein